MTMTMTAKEREEIAWRDWSVDAFNDAREQGKLVLLDLTATWCHWCHVMDSTTYSDQQVVRRINERFVPVRVDIDRRPDISERYNRGGFPTTAFLSDRGEAIWGATYIPPAEMRSVIDAVLRAESDGSIDEALAKERSLCDSRGTVRETGPAFSREDYGAVLEGIMGRYDVEFGGFGDEPKFPHPDCVELLLRNYVDDSDPAYAAAVSRTLLAMAEGLHDPVEGGVFRYSVSRDWKVPHFEKMLETNAAFLLNLAHASAVIGGDKFSQLADSVARYLLSTLRDSESGCFFGSQDADEEYYRIGRAERSATSAPSVDETVFAGWNFEAVRALSEAGKLLGRPEWADAARISMQYALRLLWNSDIGLFRHTAGQDLYTFEDQVDFLLAAVSVLELEEDPVLRGAADALIVAVKEHFGHPDGGYRDVLPAEDSVGELRTPLRSLISNSKWAMALAMYGSASDRPELVDDASAVLSSFGRREVKAYSVFASSYLSAWKLLSRGPVKVEVHSRESDALPPALWSVAKSTMPLDAVVLLRRDLAAEGAERPFAVVCGRTGCSPKVYDAEHLRQAAASALGSQG